MSAMHLQTLTHVITPDRCPRLGHGSHYTTRQFALACAPVERHEGRNRTSPERGVGLLTGIHWGATSTSVSRPNDGKVPSMSSMFRSWFFKYGIQGAVDRWQGDELAGLVMSDVDTTNDLEALRRQVVRQGQALEELASIVAVMSRMLAESAHLDAKVLQARVEADLDARHAPPEAPSATCVHCGRMRAAREFSITPFGAVCARGCPTT